MKQFSLYYLSENFSSPVILLLLHVLAQFFFFFFSFSSLIRISFAPTSFGFIGGERDQFRLLSIPSGRGNPKILVAGQIGFHEACPRSRLYEQTCQQLRHGSRVAKQELL